MHQVNLYEGEIHPNTQSKIAASLAANYFGRVRISRVKFVMHRVRFLLWAAYGRFYPNEAPGPCVVYASTLSAQQPIALYNSQLAKPIFRLQQIRPNRENTG